MDNTAQNICTLVEKLAHATNRSPSTISRLITGSGDTIERLKRKGKAGRHNRITTDRAARSLQRLSDIWDDDRAVWPRDIPRPAQSKGAA